MALAVGIAASGCGRRARAPGEALRLGHFPHVTHAQALVARGLERRGDRRFAEAFGGPVAWYVFPGGPSAMEAVLAGALDVTYVGPNPAINAYLRSEGAEVRVVAGAARGGAGLVVRRGSGLRTPADFRGRRLATPQLGNTQDVACRAWLADGGLHVTMTGGDASVVPVANPDQLGLFSDGTVAGVWTVEPWIARLEELAQGELLVEETDAITTVLVTSRGLLEGSREEARRLVAAHEAITAWILAHPEEAQALVAEEIRALTGRALPPAILARAWPRLRFGTAVDAAGFERLVADARRVGLLSVTGSLDRLVETP
jgi:NitT/TauT family transport system substrate-binding protein